MTRIRVQAIGAGSWSDSYRVDLPSYQSVSLDYNTLVSVVDVPATDITPEMAALDEPITSLTGAQRGAWLDLLQRRYGRLYAPEVL